MGAQPALKNAMLPFCRPKIRIAGLISASVRFLIRATACYACVTCMVFPRREIRGTGDFSALTNLPSLPRFLWQTQPDTV